MLTFSALTDIGEDRRGQLVEWVEKVLFDCLNKLFVITSDKRNHQTLVSARNLLAIICEPQPYVLLIIPRKLLKVLVSMRKHHYSAEVLP